MNEYFKIGEFAKLRNTTKRALRYYEDLGLLVPSVGQDTNSYHYYHKGQLMTLDTIQFCSQLGINLKRLVPYVEKNGNLNYAGIHKLYQEHVDEQLKHLERMKLLLHDLSLLMESCNQHQSEPAEYIRQIIPRVIIFRKLDDWKNVSHNQAELTRLHAYCKERGILHTNTYGFIQQIRDNRTDYYIYTQIMDQDRNDPDIMHLPGGGWLCLQDDTLKMDIPDCFLTQLNQNQNNMILTTTMLFDKIDLEHPVWEKQLFIEEGIRMP